MLKFEVLNAVHEFKTILTVTTGFIKLFDTSKKDQFNEWGIKKTQQYLFVAYSYIHHDDGTGNQQRNENKWKQDNLEKMWHRSLKFYLTEKKTFTASTCCLSYNKEYHTYSTERKK